MSLYRTLWILSRTPLVLPEAAKQAAAGIPLTTFREYTTPKTLPTIPSSISTGDALGNSNEGIRSLGTSARTRGPGSHTQTSPTGPDADEVAHTEEAYEGSQSNPETSKNRIERQTGQPMSMSAADTRASDKPSDKGKHDVEGSRTIRERKPGQKDK